MAKRKKFSKKQQITELDKGVINIYSSFNNTIVNLANRAGNVIAWASAGSAGFKGTRKSTPFAATQTAKKVIEKIKPLGLSEVEINVIGVGSGRESAVRAFIGSGLTVTKITDVTPIPHGGARPKKPRKV